MPAWCKHEAIVIRLFIYPPVHSGAGPAQVYSTHICGHFRRWCSYGASRWRGRHGHGRHLHTLNAALAGGGLVTFDCGSAPVTITLTQQKAILSSETTVDGGGVITLEGGHSAGVFSVQLGGVLSIANLTIANGSVLAISNSGTLNVTNCTFSDNSSGAIVNSGTLTVTDSSFSGNSAVSGGAIFNTNTGTFAVSNSTFSGNSAIAGRPSPAPGAGGAILNLSIGGSHGSHVTNSTFSGNSADGGGAIASTSYLTVTDSTFSGNSAVDGGGAVDNAAACGDSSNAPCLATLTNTIVANSTQGGNCGGTMITDGGRNIEDGTTCGFSMANGSLSSTDPQLDPAGLADNGGPTQTIALQPGSPAINAGDEAACAAAPVNGADQRGFVRPGTHAVRCSTGAYEYNSPGPPTCTGDCNDDGQVTVDELLTVAAITLGNAPPLACPHGVPSGAEANISLIIQAGNNTLSGCGG